MKIDTQDLEAVEKILVKGEKVEGSATQRRLGPGGSLTSPTSVIVTDKRIIVIKRAVFGLRHDYEVFSLSTITSIKLKHGFVSSSIFVRTQGSEADSGKHGMTEGENIRAYQERRRRSSKSDKWKSCQDGSAQQPVP